MFVFETEAYRDLCAINRVTDKPGPNIKSSNKSFLYGEAVSPKPFGYSRFVCTVRPYCLSNDFLVSLF